MRRLKIGVPPGIGDSYWALCKLQSILLGFDSPVEVELVIKKTALDRAGAWPEMCGFVQHASFRKYDPGIALRTGFASQADGCDMVLWPNAVLDRGEKLESWLPQYALDQSWQIRTRKPLATPGHAIKELPVVYVSSASVNKGWMPDKGGVWWDALIRELGVAFGVPPVLIGAQWDLDMRARCRAPCYDLCGQTSLPEVAWLLENCAGVVGVISGMTILANHFRKPTIAFYPPKHHPLFPYTWIADDMPYTAINSAHTPPPSILAATLRDMVTAHARPQLQA